MILASVRSSYVPRILVEHDPGSPPHDFLHQRNVGLDPIDRRLDQHRVVNWRTAISMPWRAARMQAIRKISAPVAWIGQLRDRSLVDLPDDADVAGPAERGFMTPVWRACCNPVVQPCPVLREQPAVLVEHFVRYERRDPEPRAPAFRTACRTGRQQHRPCSCRARLRVRFLGGRFRHCADAFGEFSDTDRRCRTCSACC